MTRDDFLQELNELIKKISEPACLDIVNESKREPDCTNCQERVVRLLNDESLGEWREQAEIKRARDLADGFRLRCRELAVVLEKVRDVVPAISTRQYRIATNDYGSEGLGAEAKVTRSQCKGKHMPASDKAKKDINDLIDRIVVNADKCLVEFWKFRRGIEWWEEDRRHQQYRTRRTPRDEARTRLDPPLVEFTSLQSDALALLSTLKGSRVDIDTLYEDVKKQASHEDGVKRIKGIVLSVRENFNAGLFEGLLKTFEQQIATDYFAEAEQLLIEGVRHTGYDYVPAAVLLGAIFEHAVKVLCARQATPIVTRKPDGSPKAVSALVEELKAQGEYDEMEAKQLRVVSGIRNLAAHGEFSKFSREEVEDMQRIVQRFLTNHL